ncbi:hypothetical protein RCC89_07285 [Cytophagaceae bacterium ABcell3]|nr:hypothetical protein RCC89_07285 [Cytophagaceae bacterium ABcell3]
MRIAIFLLFCVFITSACSWTNKQRRAFKEECAQKEKFNDVVFLFMGFDNSEFDTIWVKEYSDTSLLDTFSVFVSPSQSHYGKERKVRSASIERPMNVNYTYHFMLPGQEPYELSNMKMVMWSQFSMMSEGWGCVMGEYTIDGEKFEQSANPTFIKRETQGEE